MADNPGTILVIAHCMLIPLLRTFPKVFKKLLFEQINDHMQSKFSKHLTSFSQKPQHSKCKTILNKKFILGALFMDLSNCLIP